jgi:hypothetical protein
VEIHQCSACPQASYLKKSYLPPPNHTFTDFLKHLTQQCHGEYIWQRLPLDRWQEFVLLIQLASIITSLIKFSKVNTNIFNLNWVCSVCWKASHIGKVHLIKFCNSFVNQNSHVSEILAIFIYDFYSANSWYSTQIWQCKTISASSSNHRKSATYLKSPLGVFPQIVHHFNFRLTFSIH